MSAITFEIMEQVGVLSNSTKGWSKQLNLVSWNGREPKYDIRDWDEKLEKMGRGISLSRQELHKLREYLFEMDLVFEPESLILNELQ